MSREYPSPITRREHYLKAIADRAESSALGNKMSALIDTVSGSIASFMPDATIPTVRGLTVNIEPVQDLHGYDNPWPAGGGTNLLPFEDALQEGWTNTLNGITATYSKGVMRVTGTSTSEGWTNIVFFQNIWAIEPFVFGPGEYVMAEHLAIYSRIDGGAMVNKTSAFTVENELRVYGFYMAVAGGVTVDWTVPLMFVRGTVRPISYSPYSNICPITGWDGVKVSRTGKNLYDLSKQVVTSSNTYLGIALKQGDYVFSVGKQITGLYVAYSDADELPPVATSAAYWTSVKTVYNRDLIAFTADAHKWFRLMTYETAGVTERTYQLELGTTATAYTPYQGDTYQIQLGQTVYGGKLDVTGGKMVVYRANIASYGGEPLPGAWISDRDVYAPGTSPTTGAQVVYDLATPITIDLTPVEVAVLTGQTNNILADSGDVSVEYAADLKTYIDNKIAAAASSPIVGVATVGTAVVE